MSYSVPDTHPMWVTDDVCVIINDTDKTVTIDNGKQKFIINLHLFLLVSKKVNEYAVNNSGY